MFIEKEIWNKLKKDIGGLYWDNDRMSKDGHYFLKQIDLDIKNIEKNSVKEVYVITNNAIVNDEVIYSVAGVTSSYENAKELFQKEIEKLKEEIDYEYLDAVPYDNENNFDGQVWIYDQNEESYLLYQNGEYNSNNFNITIEKFEIDQYLSLQKEDKEIS
ncbi:MAG: hypothetical protein Q4G05_01575 [Clostridia bacterium]|nr:hypothetical protein [Clostridia bacterium]